MKKIILVFLLFSVSLITVKLRAQIGRVGINTISPKAILHVSDSSVVFTGIPSGLPLSPGNVPVSGSGVRMMWYPDKAAFRAGQLSTDPLGWEKDSIGLYSVAFGLNSKAIGGSSFAVGSQNRAGGNGAIALGQSNWANGFSNIAIGIGNYANGSSAITIGNNNDASVGGNNTIAIGTSTIVASNRSVAIGYDAVSGSLGSVSIGDSTVASNWYAFATGNRTFATDRGSFITGEYNDTINDASYDRVFAVGVGTPSARSNAFTILSNGYTGIGTSTPDFKLHVPNNNSADGGWAEGIMIENTSSLASVGEAALSFRNAAITTDKKWTIGINQGVTDLAFFYGSNFSTGTGTKFAIDTLGNVGIGISTPNYGLHVANNLGADGFTSGIVVDATSTGTTGEAAISFKNAGAGGTGPKFWIVGLNQGRNLNFGYGTQFNGGTTLMTLDSVGKLGIGTTTPDEKLDVVGNLKLSGEVNRPSTGLANLVPICYGYVEADGTIGGGTGNFSVNKTGTGLYEIPITGETYSLSGYVTVVNVLYVRSFATVVPSGGKLIINTQNPAGADLNVEFNFVVYKL